MEKTTHKSSKTVASKSRATKHGSVRRSTALSLKKQQQQVTGGAKIKKGTRKSRVPMRVTRPAVSPPPKVFIDVKKVFVVGGLLPRNFDWASWDIQNHLERTVSCLLAKSPNPCFVYMSIEFSQTLNPYPVPVAVVIQSACVPTRLFALTSLQTGTEEFLRFDDVNTNWATTSHPMVFILNCNYLFSESDREQLLLHCESPAAVAAEKPVLSVSINFNGQDIVWTREEDESIEACVDEFIEDELPDANENVRATMIQRLQEELRCETEASRAATEYKQRLYREMMASDESMTVEGIEGKRVFKVFPQDARLDPVMPSSGFIQVAKGFHKTATVNRYIGNCDEIF